MQLSDQLARAFLTIGRHFGEFQGQLSRPDFTTLARLDRAARDERDLRLTDVADAEGLDRSTMSRRAASLVERGLVERLPDPADGRAQLLRLTEAGVRAVADERALRVDLVADALGDWPERDRADLARLLEQLGATLESRRASKLAAH